MVFDRLIKFFTSLKLTVVCLGFAILLVFLGTLAQKDLGLYQAQNEFFRSFLVFWSPKSATWKIPILPGGYLVGGVLLINLVASHIMRFKLTRSKIGIWLTHFGLILLLLGQLGTDMLSRESTLHLREGESSNYSEASRQVELAVSDTTDPDTDKVVAIAQHALTHGREIHPADLPFTIRVKRFFANSSLKDRREGDSEPPPVTQGFGTRAVIQELPRETEMDQRDIPSAIVEIQAPDKSLGTWLVSEYIKPIQDFTYQGRTYKLELRPRRFYQPFTLKLLEFRHDVYAGTDTPKNFSSRVQLQAPSGDDREVKIYMNNPLRYAGETFYQASFDQDNHGTVLQVVHNPSWLTPYFSCILVGLGLVIQFMTHLFGFSFKRRTA